jgi:uncharacterized protein
MLQWFHALLPREERFFELFARHSDTVVAGANALRAMLEGDDAVALHYKTVMDREQDADNITRDVLIAVRRSFITPFDRGDIRGLINSMDDAVDQMNKTAKAVQLFEVAAFEPPMREMGDLIIKAAALAGDAIPLLRAMRANAGRLNTITEEIVRIEEQTDHVCLEGLKALLQGPARTDAMAYIKGAEIYDHLEKVADCLEDVANRVNGLVIEHL